MPKKTEKKSSRKFDPKKYVSNLGKVGTFYKDNKDSKGVEGTLVTVAEHGVYAKIKGDIFPRLFASADFGATFGNEITVNGVKYIRASKGSKDKSKSKDSYGSFGKNGSKKAKSLIALLDGYKDLDKDDDDDWEELVELGKDFLKTSK